MNSNYTKWSYLLILSLIWGSSFILMKRALLYLTPVQVGALRIIFTSVFLLIIGFHTLKNVKQRHWKYLFLNAFLGSFFPAFFFALALAKIDSSVAAILNSLTPLQTLVIGFLVFGFSFSKRQIIGLIIGLAGTLFLILEGASLHPNQNYWYALFIIISTVGYAFNVNIIKKHLQELNSLTITTANFTIILLPAIVVLYSTSFFTEFIYKKPQANSLFFVLILSIVCTAIAKIIFNKLIQISSPVFSSSVTYLIPIVAFIWGILDGETITLTQLVAGVIILLGVYLTNKIK